MATSKDYIPKNAEEFNLFQLYLVAQVTANATIWNIPPTMVTELGNLSTAFGPIYAAVTNVETRSRQQVLAYNNFRIENDPLFRDFCQSFLTNNMLIPIDQRKAMGLNPRGLNPRTTRGKITTAPIVSVSAKGGGEVKFGFKVEASNTRTARHPLSNGVNVFYRIVPIGGTAPAPPPIPIGPTDPSADGGNATPAEAKAGLPSADGFEHYFNTRASFTRQLPLADIGKAMHVYAQWVNTSDSSNNSTFSMLTTIVIS